MNAGQKSQRQVFQVSHLARRIITDLFIRHITWPDLSTTRFQIPC
jgi:hypothetical protein